MGNGRIESDLLLTRIIINILDKLRDLYMGMMRNATVLRTQ